MTAHDLLRRLAEWSDQRYLVTSLYLDVDGRRFPRRVELAARAETLLKKADQGESDRDRRGSVERDVGRILSFVSDEFDRSRTRGLAIFSSSGAGLWEPVALPRPIRDRAVVGPRPYLLPLEAALERAETFCTVIVDREKARFFITQAGRTEEILDIFDDVPGQHDQGGWAQARMQRHIEEHVQRHLKHVGQVLLRRHQRRPFQRLILAGPEEIVAELERELHDYVRRTITDRATLSMHAAPGDVHAHIVAVQERLDAEVERETAGRLVSEVRSGTGRAVAGLAETLDVLEAGRVDTLVVLFGLEAAGVSCPNCGHLATGGDRCSMCGAEMVEAPDLIELAVESALRRRCRVETIPDSSELAGLGGIGALLRY
jgi:peptide chain release factor subunit 1